MAAWTSFWFSGAWFAQTTDQPRDVNGTVINVGATVKIVGTVQSYNVTSTHRGVVVLSVIHPGDGSGIQQISVDSLNLVVGS
jgi:hypothetical protein